MQKPPRPPLTPVVLLMGEIVSRRLTNSIPTPITFSSRVLASILYTLSPIFTHKKDFNSNIFLLKKVSK